MAWSSFVFGALLFIPLDILCDIGPGLEFTLEL